MAVVAESTQILPDARTKAIQHMTQSFRLINERISHADHITRQMLAVVMILSARESTRCRYDTGQVHLSGLFRMIELHGGLEKLAIEEPEIMQKTYR